MTITVPAEIEELQGRSTKVLARSKRGDGLQFVLRVEGDGDDTVILKHYGRKRSLWLTSLRQLGFRLGMGHSSVWPRDRFHTERELLELWREAGCDVPRILSTGNDRDPWILMEYCTGPVLKKYLRHADTPVEDKLARLRQLARELGARQDLAATRRDVRFIHTHPSAQHVILCGPRLVFFDLETRYRPRRDVEPLLARELLETIRSVARCLPDQVEEAVEAFASHYPHAARLAGLRAHDRRRPLQGRPLHSRAAAARRAQGNALQFPPVPRPRILDLVERHLPPPAPR